jgi:hypothetical protein
MRISTMRCVVVDPLIVRGPGAGVPVEHNTTARSPGERHGDRVRGRHIASGRVSERLVQCQDELAPCLFYTRRVRSHEWIDARSLALHEAVAAKLEARPQLLDVARANLARWLARDPAGALLEWARLLDQRPLDDILTLLRSSDERAARLRQSSPFAGVLTPEERLAILRQYDARRA